MLRQTDIAEAFRESMFVPIILLFNWGIYGAEAISQ